MKSFNDWLDDNVASTREKLAQKAETPETTKTLSLPASVVVRPVSTVPTSGVHFTANTTCIGNGLVFVEASVPRDVNEVIRLAKSATAGVAGPFAVGSHIRLKDNRGMAARVGAIARVLGCVQPFGTWVLVQWSDDDNRRNPTHNGSVGTGQMHGSYPSTIFEAV